MPEGTCTRCGHRIGQEKQSIPPDLHPADSQPPIQFDVMVSSDAGKERKQVDWKEELKKKLDQRIERRKEHTIQLEEDSAGTEGEEELIETPPTLFKYKLDRALRSTSVTSAGETHSKPKKDQHVFEEPLIRRKPIRPLQRPPGQQTLHLRPAPPITMKTEEKIEESAIEEEEQRISKEILFSRFLSGIVDLVLPMLMGFAFTIVASFLLDFDLFAPSSMKWIGLFALSFFFFNSLFFFLTSGQTPGMVVTDLQLVGEHKTDDITLTAILLRVMFFLPSALTVVGLGWAIFDPLCRCLHDLVSGTRIEPAS
jgi:uncharacterized RDD family membrane protein YckC